MARVWGLGFGISEAAGAAAGRFARVFAFSSLIPFILKIKNEFLKLFKKNKLME